MCIRDSILPSKQYVAYLLICLFMAITAQVQAQQPADNPAPVSYTHLRAHETVLDLVCRLLLENKKPPYYNI